MKNKTSDNHIVQFSSFTLQTILLLVIFLSQAVFSQNSVIKMSVSKKGIYRLDYNLFTQWHLNPNLIHLKNVKLFNNGGCELPQPIKKKRQQEWIENAIYIYNPGNDGFDPGDYILFLGKPVQDITIDPNARLFAHYIHHYSNENIYWLDLDSGEPGKRMAEIPVQSGGDLIPEAFFQDFIFCEKDSFNIFHSGLEWFASTVTLNKPYSNSIFLTSVVPNEKSKFIFKGFASGSGSIKVDVNLNHELISNFSIFGSRFFTDSSAFIGKLNSGQNLIEISGNQSFSFSFDWWELTYPRRFEAFQDYLWFCSPVKTGDIRYQVNNFASNEILLFEISDYAAVKHLTGAQMSDGQIDFTDAASVAEVKQYLALTPAAFLTPNQVQLVSYHDLKKTIISADYLIITHQDFYDAALKLAEFRSTRDTLTAEVVLVSDIYASFACGLPDPTAIRDFLKYTWDNASPRPQFVVLFGDGDYDYRNIQSREDQNWIPPFVTNEFNDSDSRAVDDWFVSFSSGISYPKMAIGRIPARTSEEAWTVVNKIMQYENTPQNSGEWKNRFTFVADDEYGTKGEIEGWCTIFTHDAEVLSEQIEKENYQVQKIYSIEYPYEQNDSTGGLIKPLVKDAIINQINRGSLLVNYIGHANAALWAHERIFERDFDIARLTNSTMLPLFYAASCRFAEFDLPDYQCMAEALLTTKDKGAIGVIAATRDTYEMLNSVFNKAFYTELFNFENHTLRIGEALAKAKNQIREQENEKYVLLGDPALRLAVPALQAQITNLQPIAFQVGNLLKLGGNVVQNNQLITQFNGQAFIQVFDAQIKKRRSIEGFGELNYKLTGRPVYRGTCPVINGQFNTEFMVPKDATINGTDARICVYFWNDQTDGHGLQNNIQIQNNSTLDSDVSGPGITLSFYDDRQEHRTPLLAPTMFITLSDKNGINITGTTDHEISLTINDNPESKINLTDYFTYNSGSSTTGKVIYSLDEQTRGSYKFTVQAFDNYNNSSTASFDMVVGVDEPALAEIPTTYVLHQNYPNPFNATTQIRYELPEKTQVHIQIMNVLGQKVVTLVEQEQNAGQHHITWDGSNAASSATASGIYFMRMQAGDFQATKRMILLK